MVQCTDYPNKGDIINGIRGNYRIIGKLPSSGKYARLYEVLPIDKSYTTHLAKFFKEPKLMEYPKNGSNLGTEEQRAFKRFKKEPRFLELFNHPNIVGYIDEYPEMKSGSSSECFYIQEYLSGISLKDYIQNKSFPVNPNKIAIGIASALVELHIKEVIHRDIHPGNIFISDSNPKLIDFGSAVGGGITRPYKFYGGQCTGLVGTFHRAPEAINPTEAVHESDIYSFGITLLELLNKQIPSSEDRKDRYSWIERNLNMLSESQPQLESLIKRMLRHDLKSRPISTEVLKVLREITPKESPKIIKEQSSYMRLSRPSKVEVGSEQDESILPKIIIGLGVSLIAGAAIWLGNKYSKKKKEKTNSKLKQKIKGGTGTVLLDVDNTLAYKTKGVSNYIVLPPGDKYISPKTIENLKIIEKKVPIILVTSRRATNYELIKKLIPHKYAIFESGAIIFEYSKGQINWQGNDEKKLKILWKYELTLNNLGIKTIKDGRLASFRIIKKDNEKFKKSNLNIPNDIKLVNNGPFWDFVLKEAGKENAAKFLLNQMDYSIDKSLFVGDDINDIGLLKLIRYPITFVNAKKRVVNTVKERGGYITKKINHEGINEILDQIKINLG